MTKVLIVHPDFSRLGGIETYLLKVGPRLKTEHVFCAIAQRPGESNFLQRITRILGDYLRFWKELGRTSCDIVHLNPSLEIKSFFREALFLLLAKLRGKKVLVFIHGWQPVLEQKIGKNGLLFRLLYGRTDEFIVLAQSFADTLSRWGIKKPIHLETTVIDDNSLSGFDLESAIKARLSAKNKTVAFASRIIPAKGLDITLHALSTLQRKGGLFELIIAGDGTFTEEARALAKHLSIQNTRFVGSLSPDQVYELLRNSHVLCFPTQHAEGFPNIIVEAMAFGLPIVSRPVGGVADFFEAGVHGYLSEDTNPDVFAILIERIFANPQQYCDMAHANHQYAKKHFLASQAAVRLDRIYQQIQGS